MQRRRVVEIEQVLKVVGLRVTRGQPLRQGEAILDQRENRAMVADCMRYVRPCKRNGVALTGYRPTLICLMHASQ